MELMLILIILALLTNWLSKVCGKIHAKMLEDDKAKEAYDNRLLRSIERLSESECAEEEKETVLESFLRGNKRIITKNAVKKAMEEQNGLED